MRRRMPRECDVDVCKQRDETNGDAGFAEIMIEELDAQSKYRKSQRQMRGPTKTRGPWVNPRMSCPNSMDRKAPINETGTGRCGREGLRRE